jgi:hypothetical protein
MARNGPSRARPRHVARRSGALPGCRPYLLKVGGWHRPELHVSAWRASPGVQVSQTPHEVQDRTPPGPADGPRPSAARSQDCRTRGRQRACDPTTRLHARCPAAADTSPAACVGSWCVACVVMSFEHLNGAAAGSMAAGVRWATAVLQRLGAAWPLDAAPIKRPSTAVGVRLFHGCGREALATYRTAAAVGKSSSSAPRLLA